jgi:hypothetical protein
MQPKSRASIYVESRPFQSDDLPSISLISEKDEEKEDKEEEELRKKNTRN